jgi:hypothetical protein
MEFKIVKRFTPKYRVYQITISFGCRQGGSYAVLFMEFGLSKENIRQRAVLPAAL